MRDELAMWATRINFPPGIHTGAMYCAQPEGAHHRAEGGVGERQTARIALSQLDFAV
ncbi:hypothetical protein [Mycobacterium simiae]|uniref:hypothetical protein n=1 Tax=Mycobacterium simiae TaxID=1784 RepID=UPI00165EC847|nr:hypothetical protein [Mycobacterium simiae]